ncbi:uncharacterized protein B0I36DRAFT_318179 [Microdochium trichocladiopsis]|uniref:Uncharacterized protein n=1 Tax=Microdochium trichocladiopsis TaxID=1682393 RepID=A0A9P8YBJ7_9PEZI|nr:uncharacterized protein B0I36DRAFT_318179 [Microdochium trichocladiopsis]KAH7035361.1 hypothetical protein B0I36DRAFT_318179 [Microdochium trichocladiopsis]
MSVCLSVCPVPSCDALVPASCRGSRDPSPPSIVGLAAVPAPVLQASSLHPPSSRCACPILLIIPCDTQPSRLVTSRPARTNERAVPVPSMFALS